MRTVTAIALAVVLLAAGAITQERRPQDVALQAAIRTETVDGNLESAVKQFADIAARYTTDRATVATALVHLAGCYQKRGDTQARSIYERIVREFADQKDAVAIARARLGSNGRPGSIAMSYRHVWAGPKVDGGGSISADGRYLSYVDWETGDLAVHDFSDGSDRRITNKPGGWQQSNEFAEQSAMSRDARSIAYAWFDGKDKYQLRVADLTVTPARVRTVLEGEWLAPLDWSPDGKSLAVVYNASRAFESTRIGLVSVAEGTLRALREPANTLELFFSPDGKHLLFDEGLPAASENRDVLVMTLADRTVRPIAPNEGFDRAMGWSPDGTRVLFASDRGGSTGLWAQPVKDGVPEGPPERVKSDIGDSSLGLSASGGLFVALLAEGRSVYTAEVDFTTGTVTKAAERLADRYIGMHEWPDWSRDGKLMSFVYARNWSGRTPTIAIRSLETNVVREIPMEIRNARNPLWSPDGRTFVMSGVNRENKRGIYEIDAQTGAVRTVVQSADGEFFTHPEYSPDGRKIYFTGHKGPDSRNAIFELDRTSGSLREVARTAGLTMIQISPDGRFLATIRRTTPERDSTVLLVPTSGGEPREVIRASAPQVFTGNASWTPDSRALMVNTFWAGTERRETWLVPVDGGPPKSLALPGHSWGRIRVHPDGRRVAYHAGNLKTEVWVLENFLPAQSSGKR